MPRRDIKSWVRFVQRDYDEYHGVHTGSNEASGKAGADDVSWEELFDEELLWVQAADEEDVTEQTLSSA